MVQQSVVFGVRAGPIPAPGNYYVHYRIEQDHMGTV